MNLLTDIRPSTPADFINSSAAVASLLKSLAVAKAGGMLMPPLLLHGDSGCGKTTLARIIASELGTMLDEHGPEQERGVQAMRDKINEHGTPSLTGEVTLLLDECHELTTDAQQALLKFVEEPPSWVQVILCTTDPGKIIPTLRKRCQAVELRPTDAPGTEELVKRGLAALGTKADATKISTVLRETGVVAPRDILNGLQTMLAGGTPQSDEKAADVFSAVRAAYAGKTGEAVRILGECGNRGIINFRYMAASYGKAILLKKRDQTAINIVAAMTTPMPSEEVLASAAVIAALWRVSQ
jgi:DNA polymerase III gamma/tau subunit